MSAIGTRRRSRGRTDDLELRAEINVTSLVDVAFTLLIIFIITAPILQGGLEVAVPRADVRPLTAQEEPLFLTVQRDGSILLEESPIAAAELDAALRQMASAGEVERIYLRADSLAPYGPVLRAMTAAYNSGLGWSAVAEPFSGGN